MVLTSSGEVLTNNHVISGATTIKVVVPKTGKTYTARVVGYDKSADVAVLKLNGTGLPIAFEAAPATGSYLKQPRRSISASSSQSSR